MIVINRYIKNEHTVIRIIYKNKLSAKKNKICIINRFVANLLILVLLIEAFKVSNIVLTINQQT